MKKIRSLCLLLLVVACQPVQVSVSSHITENEVVTALQDNGVQLIETPFGENIFGSRLGNVKPSTYKVDEHPLYIFEFDTEKELAIGKKEFEEKTINSELEFASTYEKRNIFIFYSHGHNVNSESVPFDTEIQTGLDNLIEG